MNNRSEIIVALKGLIVGGTLLIPGVSGGTMAMILGVYNKLISSVSSFTKHKKDSILFLALFSLGGAIGILALANPLLTLLEHYPMPVMYFFTGAVAGGVPLIIKQSRINNFSWKWMVCVLIGLFIVSLFALIPKGIFEPEIGGSVTGILIITSAGFIAAIALVLPGISVSYFLLIMGLYHETMRAISHLNISFLLPLGIGILLGILLTTKILEHILTKHPQSSYLIILGFILGSLLEVFPGIPSPGIQLLICPLTLSTGFLAVILLSRKAG